jgi:putative methyltransferase (TIGR04325 family)
VLLALSEFCGVDRDQEPVAVNSRLKRLANGLTPPLLISGARRLARAGGRRRPPEWEHIPEGWARAGDDLRGWNEQSVLDAYRSKLPALRATLDGPGPLAFSPSAAVDLGTANIGDQNTILAFAYALLLASRNRDRVSVLDWGGGLGYFSFIARALLPDTVELDYHCKDMPVVCEYGRQALPEINFWDDDGWLTRRYDLVFASSSLQYSEAWESTLAQLAQASTDYLFLTRVPVVFDHTSFVVLQRAHAYRFDTEYLSWVFNKHELLDTAAGAGMDLVREFILGYQPNVVGAPEQDETRAYLFRSAHGLT